MNGRESILVLLRLVQLTISNMYETLFTPAAAAANHTIPIRPLESNMV